MKDIREVVKRNDWQELRKTFIGTWKTRPNINTAVLRNWLGPIQSAEDDKLRIIHNYLTGSGFRIGVIKHPGIDELLNEVRYERAKRNNDQDTIPPTVRR